MAVRRDVTSALRPHPGSEMQAHDLGAHGHPEHAPGGTDAQGMEEEGRQRQARRHHAADGRQAHQPTEQPGDRPAASAPGPLAPRALMIVSPAE